MVSKGRGKHLKNIISIIKSDLIAHSFTSDIVLNRGKRQDKINIVNPNSWDITAASSGCLEIFFASRSHI